MDAFKVFEIARVLNEKEQIALLKLLEEHVYYKNKKSKRKATILSIEEVDNYLLKHTFNLQV